MILTRVCVIPTPSPVLNARLRFSFCKQKVSEARFFFFLSASQAACSAFTLFSGERVLKGM